MLVFSVYVKFHITRRPHCGGPNVLDNYHRFIVSYENGQHLCYHFYRPQRSCEGYVFTAVCLSTGEVCLSACWDATPGTVRILLECILVQTLGVLFVNLQKSFITRNAIISYPYFSFQQNHDPIPHDVVETFRQVYFIFRGNMMRGRGMPLGRGGPMRPMPPGMFKPGSP